MQGCGDGLFGILETAAWGRWRPCGGKGNLVYGIAAAFNFSGVLTCELALVMAARDRWGEVIRLFSLAVLPIFVTGVLFPLMRRWGHEDPAIHPRATFWLAFALAVFSGLGILVLDLAY